MLFVGSRTTSLYSGNSLMGNPLGSSLCQRQPLTKLMHTKGCSLVLSTSLLAVGITVTVMSLQSFSSANKVFLVGPILMTVGILGLSRSLMQYFKQMDSRRRRQENRVRVRAIRNRCQQQQQQQQQQQRVAPQQIRNITISHIIQQEDSEVPIYLGRSDSEETGYSDDPPPYDNIANTGVTVTSHIQDRARSSSLPPYDEGVTNPALDLSTETFPAPPPYEIVAVQPPSYSPAVVTEGEERPVLSLAHMVRADRKHRRRSSSQDPTQRTVQAVAHRLAARLQESLGSIDGDHNHFSETSGGPEINSQPAEVCVTSRGQTPEHNVSMQGQTDDSVSVHSQGDNNVCVGSELDAHHDASLPDEGHAVSVPGQEEVSEPCDTESGVTAQYVVVNELSDDAIEQTQSPVAGVVERDGRGVTLDHVPGESHTDIVSVSLQSSSLTCNNNETEASGTITKNDGTEQESDIESYTADAYLNNNPAHSLAMDNDNDVANDQFEKHLNLALPITDPLK